MAWFINPKMEMCMCKTPCSDYTDVRVDDDWAATLPHENDMGIAPSSQAPSTASHAASYGGHSSSSKLVSDERLTSFRPQKVRRLQTAQSFTVKLRRVGENWRSIGMVINDDDPNVLIVDEVLAEGSLIGEWNAAQPDAMRVTPGCIVTAVDGHAGSSDGMLASIQASTRGSELVFTIERGAEILKHTDGKKLNNMERAVGVLTFPGFMSK